MSKNGVVLNVGFSIFVLLLDCLLYAVFIEGRFSVLFSECQLVNDSFHGRLAKVSFLG